MLFDSYKIMKLMKNLDFLYSQLEIVMYGRYIDDTFSSPFIKKYIQNNLKKKKHGNMSNVLLYSRYRVDL